MLLSQVLSHSCNIGYENCHNFRMKTINGQKILNLQHLKQIVDETLNSMVSEGKQLIFESDTGTKIVLDADEVKQAQDQVSLLIAKIINLLARFRHSLMFILFF